MLASSSSNAAWVVQTEGPDVFGDTRVTAMNAKDTSHAIWVECNQESKLLVAFMEKTGAVPDDVSIPAELAIQVDKRAPVKLPGEMKKWNDNYAGVISEGKTPELVAVVKSMATAKSQISIGFKLGDKRAAIIVDAGRSSSLVKALEGCKL